MVEDDDKNRKENTSAVPKRVRRFSIFLILGVAALLAAGIWFFTSWYSERYYANDSPLTKLPPPPAVGNNSTQ